MLVCLYICFLQSVSDFRMIGSADLVHIVALGICQKFFRNSLWLVRIPPVKSKWSKF